MGGGSGFFISPNTNAIMSSVEPHTRGAAAGILSMLNNTGQMLSITIVFPLALSQIPFVVVQRVFINGGGVGHFLSTNAPLLSCLHFPIFFLFLFIINTPNFSSLRAATRANSE